MADPRDTRLAALPAPFRSDFARGVTLPPEEWDWLADRVLRRTHARGEVLLREGQRAEELFYIEQGIVRIVARSGEDEVNLGFDCEGRFVTELESLRAGGPARHSVVALEPVRCLAIARDTLERLEGRHHGWRDVVRAHFEHLLARKARKEHAARTLSPAERYRRLVAEGSYLVRRVPQYHLASFLGITPETLSRIRARS